MITIAGGGYRAVIDPQHGGNCLSLRHEGYRAAVLREPPANGVKDNPYLYGMPVLYPVNRIAGGRFDFDGRTYQFPVNEAETDCCLHGFLHDTAFSAEQVADNAVCCRYDAPYGDFPHRFSLEIAYRLDENGLVHTVTVENRSERAMPHFLGFHTTFRVPFIEGSCSDNVRLSADVGEWIERDSRYLPTGRILPPDRVSERIQTGRFGPAEQAISRHYRAAGDGRMVLTDIAHGVAMVYETDPQYGWRLFYNGEAGEYICLEPMTCMANCQNAPFDRAFGGFDAIPPHAAKTYVSRIYLKEC